MSINFFQDCCKTESNKPEFGLCDDIPNSSAYIDEINKPKWIGIVKNPDQRDIQFFAIDNCVIIRRGNGDKESSCEGILKENTNLIFVELKERESGKWFKKGREQITITINIFKQNYDLSNYNSIKAYVCNSLKPRSNFGRVASIQQFYDETGFILKDQQEIIIS